MFHDSITVNVCDYIIQLTDCQSLLRKTFFVFSKNCFAFWEKCVILIFAIFLCACSSVDRAPASGAGCVGSIPIRRTKCAEGVPFHKKTALWSEGCFLCLPACRPVGAPAILCGRFSHMATAFFYSRPAVHQKGPFSSTGTGADANHNHLGIVTSLASWQEMGINSPATILTIKTQFSCRAAM